MRQAKIARALDTHHQEGFGPGTRHHAIEQVQRRGDRPRRQVFVHRQRPLEQRAAAGQRVAALIDADAPEVLSGGTGRAHRVVGDEGEHRVGPARTVGVRGIARELAEAAQHLAKRIDVIGVGCDAGHDVGVARLHCTRGPAHRHHARGAAGGDVVEPAWRQAQVLSDAHRGVGRQREAADREAVELLFLQPRDVAQAPQGLADEPVCTADRVPHVRHGHGHREHHAVVTATRHVGGLRFSARVSMQCGSAGNCAAIALSSPRWIFCEGVSGNASTNAT